MRLVLIALIGLTVPFFIESQDIKALPHQELPAFELKVSQPISLKKANNFPPLVLANIHREILLNSSEAHVEPSKKAITHVEYYLHGFRETPPSWTHHLTQDYMLTVTKEKQGQASSGIKLGIVHSY